MFVILCILEGGLQSVSEETEKWSGWVYLHIADTTWKKFTKGEI
jgi:hypothetical protein